MEARSQLRHRPTKRKALSILADWQEIVNVIKGDGAEHRLYHHVICVLRLCRDAPKGLAYIAAARRADSCFGHGDIGAGAQGVRRQTIFQHITDSASSRGARPWM